MSREGEIFRLVNAIVKILEQNNERLSDPEFLSIKSPLSKDEGWCVEIWWTHHDGDVCEFRVCKPELEDALYRCRTYVVDREMKLRKERDE